MENVTLLEFLENTRPLKDSVEMAKMFVTKGQKQMLVQLQLVCLQSDF